MLLFAISANTQIVVVNGLKDPDENFIELWNYLIKNTPNTSRIIVLNRTKEIRKGWKNYSNEKIMCVGIGETIDEETAVAIIEQARSQMESTGGV